jgi:hypothetical protein
LKRSVDVEVPYEKQILVSMNTGVPRVLSAHRWSGFGRAITRLVGILDAEADQPREPATQEALEARVRVTDDRRSGLDRRMKDVGYAGIDRRSGVDRRMRVPESERLELAL